MKGTRIAAHIFTMRAAYYALLPFVEGIPRGLSDTTTDLLLQETGSTARLKISHQAIRDAPHIA